jgi:hypothetical protein
MESGRSVAGWGGVGAGTRTETMGAHYRLKPSPAVAEEQRARILLQRWARDLLTTHEVFGSVIKPLCDRERGWGEWTFERRSRAPRTPIGMQADGPARIGWSWPALRAKPAQGRLVQRAICRVMHVATLRLRRALFRRCRATFSRREKGSRGLPLA